MNEIVNFFKGILMADDSDQSPVGLCSFEHQSVSVKKAAKVKRAPKRELRLSELIDG